MLRKMVTFQRTTVNSNKTPLLVKVCLASGKLAYIHMIFPDDRPQQHFVSISVKIMWTIFICQLVTNASIDLKHINLVSFCQESE